MTLWGQVTTAKWYFVNRFPQNKGVAVNLATQSPLCYGYGNNLRIPAKAPTIPPNASRKFCIC
ncbi:hypothetical protein KCP70_12805 [Salmonella enterica subsp. enterica]|nr:hypothetical protein KCP70_12805 [Salmonella enterica subsp. enterica]